MLPMKHAFRETVFSKSGTLSPLHFIFLGIYKDHVPIFSVLHFRAHGLQIHANLLRAEISILQLNNVAWITDNELLLPIGKSTCKLWVRQAMLLSDVRP